jgi:predicted transcriptional regulator
MIARLSKELASALHATGGTELEVLDPETQRTYFLVDCDTHRRAMEALHRQQDHEAIAEGLAQMEAGEGLPVDEAFALMRSRLGWPLEP